MTVNTDRLKHSLAVANKMKKLVSERPDKFPVNADDMFVLGLLHDIGYQLSGVQEEHAKIGGELLKKQGYKYWKEVYYHGIPQFVYDSPELRLLNYADMITGPAGEDVTIEERIKDIANRYGRGSRQERDAISLSEILQKRCS